MNWCGLMNRLPASATRGSAAFYLIHYSYAKEHSVRQLWLRNDALANGQGKEPRKTLQRRQPWKRPAWNSMRDPGWSYLAR